MGDNKKKLIKIFKNITGYTIAVDTIYLLMYM